MVHTDGHNGDVPNSDLVNSIVLRAAIINLGNEHFAWKKHTSFSKDPHPKLEITATFDLFLNTDLCESVFSSVDNGMERK